MVSKNGEKLSINLMNGKISAKSLDVDMVILACAIVPGKESKALGKILGIELDSKGFFLTPKSSIGTVETVNKGIFVVGCAEGPKDIQRSVIQAESAAGKVISLLG